MWIADQWQDYELLDCGSGEKLERWDRQFLVRPDPQAIWETDRKHLPGGRLAGGICGPRAAAGIGRKRLCRRAGGCITGH